MSDPLADVIELRLPPDDKYLSVVRLTVGGVAARAGVSVDDVDDLKVAVCEAVTNAIEHAYEGMERRLVVLRMAPSAGELRIEVIDEGVGFDASSRKFHPEADIAGDGGLGLYLVHRYMDDVRIESAPGSGTRVIMTKRLAR